MDYVVEKMESFQVIGFEREFSMDSSYLEIPKFWDEFFDKYMKPLFAQEKPEDEVQQTICDCCIGEYGICIDDIECYMDSGKRETFNYGGKINGYQNCRFTRDCYYWKRRILHRRIKYCTGTVETGK